MTGRVNDLVMGTVNAGQAKVTVNGIVASVSHRTFKAEGVPLIAGVNTITVKGVDATGNQDTAAIHVIRDAPVGMRLMAVSGNNQTAGIHEPLPSPLIVSIIDDQGVPQAGKDIVFRFAQGDGQLVGGTTPASGEARVGMGLLVKSNAEGRASVRYILGGRAGVGNHRVDVTSPGIVGAAVFLADAITHPAALISVDSGGLQTGVVGRPLPKPFVAVCGGGD